jgi:methionyl-tRNA formyltransferase
MRVVFFGTPDFAVPTLQALVAERFPVVAVVTQPDRATGRSRSVLTPPPVKVFAEQAGLPVLQPERPVGDLFVTSLKRFDADVGVVVAYGHVLRPDVLAIPRLGMLNVHASLLPRYRGAAPIHHAILNGDAETGVTIMQMEAGLDTGAILHRVVTAIDPDDTTGELWRRLAMLGASALLETLSLISGGLARPTPQDDTLATYAGKIDRSMARIDWSEDAAAVARRIRAFDPTPGAWATLDGATIKLFGARARSGSLAAEDGDRISHAPGTVLLVGERLLVACGHGSVMVREVQPEGRSRLDIAAWARGRGITPGQCFT